MSKYFRGCIFGIYFSLNAIANTEYSIQSVSLKSRERSLNTQKSVVSFRKLKEIDGSVKFDFDGSLLYATTNSIDNLGVEQTEPFSIELVKFKFLKEFDERMYIIAGFDSPVASSFATAQVSGPGLGLILQFSNMQLKTNFLSLPSQQRYYLSNNTSSSIAHLWSNSLQFIPFSNKVKFHVNYNYFQDLGPEIAYSSNFRGNSVMGVQGNSQFIYDYSLVSVKTMYDFEFGNSEVEAFLEYSKNLGAFSKESNIYDIGLQFTLEKNTFGFEFIEVQSNAMIAIFLPEFLYETNNKGIRLNYQRKLALNMNINTAVGQFENGQTGNRQTSFQFGINYEI